MSCINLLHLIYIFCSWNSNITLSVKHTNTTDLFQPFTASLRPRPLNSEPPAKPPLFAKFRPNQYEIWSGLLIGISQTKTQTIHLKNMFIGIWMHLLIMSLEVESPNWHLLMLFKRSKMVSPLIETLCIGLLCL